MGRTPERKRLRGVAGTDLPHAGDLSPAIRPRREGCWPRRLLQGLRRLLVLILLPLLVSLVTLSPREGRFRGGGEFGA